jgi:fumarylacetoacetase
MLPRQLFRLKRSMNETLDPQLESWVPSAQDPATPFPIQNLPYAVFSRTDGDAARRIGVGIGAEILDIRACADAGFFEGEALTAARACSGDTLNPLMALEPRYWRALRHRVSHLLSIAQKHLFSSLESQVFVRQKDVRLHLPVEIHNYTDFYSSIHHAMNVGKLVRPDNPLLPNYKHIPIGYHGRASSVHSGPMTIRRPFGQVKAADQEVPQFVPSRALDYEVEIGVFVGQGNELGRPVTIDRAGDHLFGFCLVNDWSARDIQTWEYQPLGPFLAKSFATTISPWIVTSEALEPFRAPFARSDEDPAPLPYLTSKENSERGVYSIQVETAIRSARMREENIDPYVVSKGSADSMYWTFAQLLTHHTSNGCNLVPGDLLASGTISGVERCSWGSLLEVTRRGQDPLELPSGERRGFLEDGDEVIMRGWCRREGARSIGFGECQGIVAPAVG